MQVQKINNYQAYSKSNLYDRKKTNNVAFGASPVIKDMSSSPIFKLPVEYVFEFSRSRFYRPNIFIGSGLYDNIYDCNTPTCLEILKKAGIKTVIDLDGIDGKYRELVENAGLKYYGYSVHDNLSSANYRRKEKKDNLIDFIKEMQKDNIYLSGHTVMTRDTAALINGMFNPKFDESVRLSQNFIEAVIYADSFFKDMYGYMTQEDKKSIGWTPEFEKRFKEKMKL